MDSTPQSLWLRVQQSVPDSGPRQAAIADLANHILKSRKVGKPVRGEPFEGIYREIFEAAQQHLQVILTARLETLPAHPLSTDESYGLRDQALRWVLTPERLQQFALATQPCQPRTAAWQHATHELTAAILLSGKLTRPPGLTQAVYQDVLQRTLEWVYRHIQSYDSQRGTLMSWVNYRLSMIAREVKQVQQDTYTQSAQGRILRVKYQLSAIVKRVNQDTVQNWLMLHFKQCIADANVSTNMIGILGLMLILGMLLKHQPEIGDPLLFELVQATIVAPRLISLNEEGQQIDEIAQPAGESSLMDDVRQYFVIDPQGLCQKHIRHHPQATIQRIALSRMDDVSWQTLSDQLGVAIPALSNFYQRNLKVLAPGIRQFVQD
jgi:hypothetical protein